VLIYPATQQKQRDLLDTVTRTFYLVNADPKQAQTLIRTIAKTRDIYVDDRLNLLVVRDTPQVMRLIERLIANLDLPDPEVMLDLEVLEVSSKDVDQLGLSWPSTASYGVPDSTASLTTSSSLRWSVANPLALATLNATRGATNLLANPKIRARNREKAKILLGEKLPVFTTTTTANVGVSSSVNYIDVGLKLDIEPQVQLDGDVTMKVALEVSSVTDKTSRSDGSLAYQVGTRQASTTLRLRDGETQVLAGLLNDNESHSASGIPGLLDIPILKHLFGTITNSRDKTEVVLLVTPHIIRNIVQPVAASSFLPSGTEAQPGAAPLQLRQGEARSSGGIRGNVGGPRMGAMGNGRPGAPAEAQRLSGPDEVLPAAVAERLLDAVALQLRARLGGASLVSRLTRAWPELNAPRELRPGVWLVPRPGRVQLTPLAGQGGELRTSLLVEAWPEVRHGDRPAAPLPPVPTPLPGAGPATGLHLALRGDLALDAAAEQLGQRLVPALRRVNGRPVRLHGVRLWGNGGEAVLALTFASPGLAEVYLLARPVYDALRNEVVFRDLAFLPDSRRYLARTAPWLDHPGLLAALGAEARLGFDPALAGAMNGVRELHEVAGRGLTLHGGLRQVRPQALYFTEDRLVALVLIEGRLALEATRR
jgi:hypothetical protein